MVYKVNYYTLALFDDGTTGNVTQSRGHFYTSINIDEISRTINEKRKKDKLFVVITKIEEVGGFLLTNTE